MKRTFAILITILLSIGAFAQNENDALRYSLINYGGTARFSGMSGAYGAVGANFTTLSQNPAGIGLYRKSEFSITPMFANNKTQSGYLNNSTEDFRNTLYLGNAGYVMSIKLNEGNGSHLKQVQFGFGMNTMALFNNRSILDGMNNQNSLITQYLYDADDAGPNRSDLDEFGAGMAYDVNLLFQDTNSVWMSDLPDGGMQQTKIIETRGSTSETVLSAGTNFDDKLFLGVTFGFPRINYQEESTLTEKDDNYLSPFLKSFERAEYLDAKGTGFNFKFGFIYKPADFIRIGGAIHTPTSFGNITESYGSSMTANYDQPPLTTSNATSFSDDADGTYEYRLTTPMRAIGSLALVVGQHGILSADYEYIDYSSSRLRASDFGFTEENNTIRSAFTAANNFRFGTEWKLGIYALRGGYSMYGSPYKGSGSLGSRTGYSLGFGVQEKAYFVDFAYNHTDSEDNYYMYNIAPTAKNSYSGNTFSFTVGFRL